MSSRTKSRQRSTRLQGQRASRTAEQNDAVCSKESASPEPPPVKRPKVSSPHGYPYEAVPGEPLDACDLSHEQVCGALKARRMPLPHTFKLEDLRGKLELVFRSEEPLRRLRQEKKDAIFL